MKARRDPNAFVAFLGTNPDTEAVCQFVVMDWPETRVQSAALWFILADANLGMGGFFGEAYDPEGRGEPTSLWSSRPPNQAVRERRPVVFADRTTLQRAFPIYARWVSTSNGHISHPILLGGAVTAALELNFREPLADPEADVRRAETLALTLALHVALIRERRKHLPGASDAHLSAGTVPAHLAPNPEAEPAPPAATPRRRRAKTPPPERREPEPNSQEVSPRQRRIIELMARGMTNGQIASALGFSESTIRQESMSIYVKLAVPGRREAVEAATALGLLAGAGGNGAPGTKNEE